MYQNFKNKKLNNDYTEYRTGIFKATQVLKKIDGKEIKLLTFDPRLMVWAILNDIKYLDFVNGFFTSKKDHMLEEDIFSTFKKLGLKKENFNSFIENRKSKWRYINHDVKKSFAYKYQANSLLTYQDTRDFEGEELTHILKTSPMLSQQSIIPKYELDRLKKDFNKQHRIDKLHYNEMMSKYKQNKSEFLKDKTQIIKLFLENTYNQYRPEFFIKYIINEKLINRLNTKNINNERKIITMIENRSKQSTKFQKDFQRGVDLIVQYILFHKIFIFFKDKSVTPADKRKIIYILIDHITKNINKLRTMPMSIWSQYLLSKKDTSTFKKLNNLLKKNVILENNLNPDKNINYFMFIDEFIKKTELPKLKKKIIHNAINNISKILSKELKNSTISISKKHPIKEIRANNRNLDTESREIDGYVYEYCLIIKKK